MRDISDFFPDFSTPGPRDILEGAYDGAADLSKVTLVSFTATPQQIGPFESSQIAWEVDGPERGWSVKLNGVPVERTGTRIESPTVSHLYVLIATNGLQDKLLGRVEVGVDVSACEIDPTPAFGFRTKVALFYGVEALDDLAVRGGFNGGVDVTVTYGRVDFKLRLEGKLDNLPNPDINVEGAFGLYLTSDGGPRRVTGGLVYLEIRDHLGFGDQLLLSSPPLGPLGFVLYGNAVDRLKGSLREGIPAALNSLIASPVVQGTAPDGMELQSVRLSPTDDGWGLLRRTWCPAPPRVIRPPTPPTRPTR